MNKLAKVILVGLVTFGMLVDPVLACRFFSRHWEGRHSCAYVCPMSCSEEAVVEESSYGCSATEPAQQHPASQAPAAPDDLTESVVVPPAVPESPPMPMPRPVADMPDLESTRPANVETPAEAPPIPKLPSPDDEPADDLFGPPSTVPQTNIPPQEENSVMMPAEPADEPAGDLFGAPAEEAPPEEPADQPAEEQPADEQPAEEEPAEEEEPSVDDLFGDFGMILDEPGGLSSDALRQWVDNTGRFTCQGRLIRIADGHVRLLKDNGRTTTVPFSRLSSGDRHFVERQASAQHFESLNQTAQH